MHGIMNENLTAISGGSWCDNAGVQELTIDELQMVSGGDGGATATGYAGSCAAGAVTAGLAAAATGVGVPPAAAGGCLLGMLAYGITKLIGE